MTYEESLEYIHGLRWQGKKNGLEHTKKLLQKCNHPEKELRFIHIAGTNGKGSTAAMLAAVLQAAEYKTGLYTSPYIERYNERIQVDGMQISDEELASHTTALKEAAEQMEVLPSEFEFGTVLAMEYFREQGCDIVVLETGLGGLYDSTNVVEKPEICVITMLGYDHQVQLGSTIEEIAMAKAGIIKQGVPVVYYGNDRDALGVIQAVCEEKYAKLVLPDFTKLKTEEEEKNNEYQIFSYKKYEDIFLPLLGRYQQNNAAVVIEALGLLRLCGFEVSKEQMYQGFLKTSIPVRMEHFMKKPSVWIDGSHNVQGMEATVESLRYYCADKIIFVYAAMEDKDIKGSIPIFLPLAKAVYTAAPAVTRSVESEELAKQVREEILRGSGYSLSPEDVISCQTVGDALQKALEAAGEEDNICVLGSLYLAGEARTCLRHRSQLTPTHHPEQ